ncbi:MULTISPECIES: DUF4179 domain-containing protein [Bacillus]|uniref:DUF4179 domain-containing protein n=1 Tax=Bacillus TaxID=1386 RepID=UPI00101D8E12|nr:MULTISPECIES: DUF4179 domain-containing protein [Bacillus]RYI25625.1 DUF4179 domain-containing protein [Bacillus infantis]
MFEKEEKKLEAIRERYQEFPVPDERLEEAIMKGFRQAKAASPKKRFIKRSWLPGLAAALLLLGFLTSIRVSPAFANYVAELPGMEKLVDLIRYDKGWISAVENNYMQPLGISREKNGVRVTLDGAIRDERGLVVFYTVESEEKQVLQTERIILTGADGKELPPGATSYGGASYTEEPVNSVSDSIDYFAIEPLKATEFKIEVKIKTEKGLESFEMDFSVENLKANKKVYTLNKTVSIKGQKITFKNVTIYPLRAAVHVTFDPENNKKIFNLDDLRLVDENGEVWSGIVNGATASILAENEKIFYLQSNYFKEPKQLYLTLNKVMAIDKEDTEVVINTETLKIIKQPKAEKLSGVNLEGRNLSVKVRAGQDYHHQLFITAKDAEGRDLSNGSSFFQTSVDGVYQEYGLMLSEADPLKYKNPITLELGAFPTWIKGDIKLPLK